MSNLIFKIRESPLLVVSFMFTFQYFLFKFQLLISREVILSIGVKPRCRSPGESPGEWSSDGAQHHQLLYPDRSAGRHGPHLHPPGRGLPDGRARDWPDPHHVPLCHQSSRQCHPPARSSRRHHQRVS